jgi:hypothetical protein
MRLTTKWTAETRNNTGPSVSQRLVGVCAPDGDPENQSHEKDDQGVFHQALALFFDYQSL